jgi:peroxiredoxin
MINIYVIKGVNLMPNKGLTVGKKAPDFALPATNNRQIRLSDYGQQPVIITFLRGTW